MPIHVGDKVRLKNGVEGEIATICEARKTAMIRLHVGGRKASHVAYPLRGLIKIDDYSPGPTGHGP